MNCKICDSEKTKIWFDDKDYFTCLDCDCIFRSRFRAGHDCIGTRKDLHSKFRKRYPDNI